MHGSFPSWAPMALPKGGELVGSGQGEAVTYPCIHAHADNSASACEGGWGDLLLPGYESESGGWSVLGSAHTLLLGRGPACSLGLDRVLQTYPHIATVPGTAARAEGGGSCTPPTLGWQLPTQGLGRCGERRAGS